MKSMRLHGSLHVSMSSAASFVCCQSGSHIPVKLPAKHSRLLRNLENGLQLIFEQLQHFRLVFADDLDGTHQLPALL
jgi:hypothetical protein